jgi:medium-chain acyl-[acyl-carrier-protein] hydrolase
MKIENDNIPHQESSNIFYKIAAFQIRANEIDVNGNVAFPNIINYFQETAWLHVIDLEITGEKLLEYDLMWVLNRMKIEVFEYPKLHETVTVKTFPSGFDKFFFYRDLYLYNAENKIIAQATSTWLLVDVNKRKLSPVPDFMKAKVQEINIELGRLPIAKGKIKPIKAADFQSKVTVKWFDLDTNNHANQTHYFKWILESLPNIVHEKQQIKSVDIILKSEAMLNDTLTVQAIDNQDDTYTHQILNFCNNATMKQCNNEAMQQ